MMPTRLRCEYLVDPLGIHELRPRLSWELNDGRRGACQTAYQVLVSDDPASLEKDEGNLWDSGKTESDQTTQVRYDGRSLTARSAAWWKVRLWDQDGQVSGWSAPGRWTIGLLTPDDWQASWIGVDHPDSAAAPPRGYHSGLSDDASDRRSLVLDLRRIALIDEIILHPAFDASDTPLPLPEAYQIVVAERADFADAITVVAQSAAPADANPTQPRVHELPPQRCRYLRLVTERLPKIDGGLHALVLGGLQVLAANENVALGAAIDVSDSLEAEGWSAESLVQDVTCWRQLDGTRPDPPPLLRKAFTIPASRTVRRARLYASALGLYALRLNGAAVGDHALAPEWTDYRTRVQYQTYDVTQQVRAGDNVIAMMLGHGWYAGRVGLTLVVPDGPQRGLYGPRPLGRAQLEIEYADGTTESIVTDGSWRGTCAGPVRAADILDGEWFDAQREPVGWDQPGFDDTGWQPVTPQPAPTPQLVPQHNEPIRKIGEARAVAIHPSGDNAYVFDFGQNFAGWCRLRTRAPRGTVISLRHVEMLTDDGRPYTANLRRAAQLDRYVASGHGIETFEPQFTYHGFRYVEVRGLPEPPTADTLVGCVVSSSAPHVGEFACSNELVNRLWSNILWTQRANQYGIPTDCPQRDERLGWTGDSTAFAATACLNMDLARFFDKWLIDMRGAQATDGCLPDFAPHPFDPELRFSGAPGWGDAGVVVPWQLYREYGDPQFLADHYDAARRWIDWIHTNNPNLLWQNNRGNDYGDWLNADTLKLEGWPDHGAELPKEIFATAFFAYSTDLLAKMAAVLERSDDAEEYAALATRIRDAFNRAYVDDEGTITGNTQAGYAIALSFDLLPDERRAAAARRMVAAFEHFGGQISTGFFCTAYLMNELARWGYVNEAYRLLTNREMPSWGYTIDQGATTMWERWDGFVAGRGFQDPGMNSFCHFALGSVGEWLYRTVAGIHLHPETPAYREFELRPIPGGDLTWARGAYRTIHGRISCTWRINDDAITIAATVPPGTRATLHLPPQAGGPITESDQPVAEAPGVTPVLSGGVPRQFQLESGNYQFRATWTDVAIDSPAAK